MYHQFSIVTWAPAGTIDHGRLYCRRTLSVAGTSSCWAALRRAPSRTSCDSCVKILPRGLSSLGALKIIDTRSQVKSPVVWLLNSISFKRHASGQPCHLHTEIQHLVAAVEDDTQDRVKLNASQVGLQSTPDAIKARRLATAKEEQLRLDRSAGEYAQASGHRLTMPTTAYLITAGMSTATCSNACSHLQAEISCQFCCAVHNHRFACSTFYNLKHKWSSGAFASNQASRSSQHFNRCSRLCLY